MEDTLKASIVFTSYVPSRIGMSNHVPQEVLKGAITPKKEDFCKKPYTPTPLHLKTDSSFYER